MSKLKTLRSLIIIVLVLISFFYVGFHIPEISEKNPLTAETTPTSWLSGWLYRKSHTIRGSTAGSVTDYQIKIYGYYGMYAPFHELTVPNYGYQEAVVYAIINDCLYWGHNFGGGLDGTTRYGRIYKTNLTTGNTTVLYTRWWRASWQGLVVNNIVYTVGEEHDDSDIMRMAVYVINTTDDSVTAIVHPNTGDCNELMGVDTNGTHLVAGERVIGGTTTGSNWPNGGGVWAIPIDTITDYTTWQRMHEDPDHYDWVNIAYFNNKWYAVLSARNTAAQWKVKSSTDLVNWNVELDYTTQNYGYNVVPFMAKCGSKLAVVAPVAVTGTLHLFVFDGTSWSDYDLNIAVTYTSWIGGIWDADESKLFITVGKFEEPATHDVYAVNLDGTGLELIASNLDGCPSRIYSGAGDIVKYNGARFYGVRFVLNTGKSGLVYKIYKEDTGNIVLFNKKCRTDFGDIRFTSSDGTTPLDYFIEDKVDGERAVFWVKVPSIPAYPDSTTIYVYYGNPSAASVSNGAATFPLWFDDFDDGVVGTEYVKVEGTENVTESGGLLYIETNALGTFQGVYIDITTPDDVRIIAKGREGAGAQGTSENKQFGVYGRFTNSNTFYILRVLDSDKGSLWVKRLSKHVAGTATTLEEKENNWDAYASEWYFFDLGYYGTVIRGTIRKERWSITYLNGTDTEITSGKTGLFVGWDDFTWSFEFDWVALAKYVDPEPTNEAWGSEESQPVTTSIPGTLTVGYASPEVLSINLYNTTWYEVSSIDPYVEYWLNMTIRHNNTLYALKNITIYMYASGYSWDSADDPNTHATFVWDNDTKEYSLVGPTGTTWAVNTANCRVPDQSQNTGTFTLAFNASKIALMGTWYINVTAWGAQDLSDSLTISVTVNFYAEIILTDTSFQFSLSVGAENGTLSVPTDGDIDFSVICNAPYNISFYTDGNWTSDGYEIDITNTNYFIGDDDSNPTEATETGIDPFAIHPTPDKATPYANQAVTQDDINGDTYATYLFQTVPAGTPTGTYTLTLYIEVVAA